MNIRSCVPNIICFETQKQLSKLNNIWVLLKSVLIDLRARKFLDAKTSLRARCMHARNRMHNLSSPATKPNFLSNKLLLSHLFLPFYHKIYLFFEPTVFKILWKSYQKISWDYFKYHCEKYRDFTWFPGVEILRKGTVFVQFRAIRPKLCGNCAFLPNFHTRKSGEMTVFFPVYI